jgi:hypothetical protein
LPRYRDDKPGHGRFGIPRLWNYRGVDAKGDGMYIGGGALALIIIIILLIWLF